MRLPSRETLDHPDHLFLHEHDLRELHNPVFSDFTRLMYLDRLRLVLAAVERWAPGRRVLDVGCAQGNFSLELAERWYRVVACDLRQSFLSYLRLKYERGQLTCVNASLERLPFAVNTFDIVLLTEVIEHVAFPERALHEIANLLAPGGILVLTTPNGARLHTGLPTLSEVDNRRELTARQFRPDADGHLFLLAPDELRDLVKAGGLSVVHHRVFSSPWITGRLMARHLSRFLPIRARRFMDRLTLGLPLVDRLLAEGQLIVGRRDAA